MKVTRLDSIILLLITCCMVGCSGCDTKFINPRMSLWYQDKIPYGTWYAYTSLSTYFPKAREISVLKESPVYNIGQYYQEAEDSSEAQIPLPELYIIVSPRFLPTEDEKNELLGFVKKGNHLVIAAMQLDDSFLDSLGVENVYYQPGTAQVDTALYTFRSSALERYQTYGYPGETMSRYFKMDKNSGWETLGTLSSGAPNCIRLQIDSGTITLHANPLQLTNFFLLHKNNHRYWSDLLSELPRAYALIWWDNYFRSPRNETDNFSSLGVFMKYPSLKWALYTILLLLAVLLFSEMKRRRKVIPVLTPPENSSLDFVTTIGRLYYQHKDNSDLARKMEAHLLEFIRQHYHIQGNLAGDQLVRQLSLKSGVGQELLDSLFYEFRMIEEHGAVSDEDLLRMNDLIEQFHIKRS